MKALILLCAVLTLSLSGCILIPVPRTFVSAPRVSGQLIDADTHKAISGAGVHFEGRTDSKVVTGDDGRFELRREHDLVLFGVVTPCPVYKFPEPRQFPGAIVIEAQRYGAITLLLKPYYAKTRFDPDDLRVELGAIEIKPANKAPAPTPAVVTPPAG
jgi:hypothetical protein